MPSSHLNQQSNSSTWVPGCPSFESPELLSHQPHPWPFTLLPSAHTAVEAFAARSAPHTERHCVLRGVGDLSPLPLGCCASTNTDFSAPHCLSNTPSLCGSLTSFLSVSLWYRCMFLC